MTGARGPATLFAAADGQAAPLSAGECVFRDARSGAVHLLPTSVLETLDACRAFAPLGAHAAALAAAAPGVAPAAITQHLEALVARKLLVADHDFLADEASDAAPGELRAVFIRACDRPEQLARLLASLAAHEAQYRGRHRYVLLDDSRDAAAQRRHAELLAAFGVASGAPVLHLDPGRRARIVERLGTPAPDVAREALVGVPGAFGGGRGYNLAALLGAGATYVLLDDDFVFPLKQPNDAQRGLDLAAPADGPARFHADADTALAAGSAVDVDAFVEARTWCGRTLASLWRDARWRVDAAALAGFAPSLHPHVVPAARVATLTHGHRGDSGAPSSRWMFVLDAASRAAFARDPARYAQALESGGVWYGPSRARIDAQTTFTPFSVDARTLVAPTMPTGRAEDRLFGALVAALDPRSIALHSSLTIGHRQEGARPRAPLAEAETPSANAWLADVIRSAAPDLRADTTGARCRALAGVLRDAASATPARRSEMLAAYLRYVRADFAARLAAVRDDASDAPDHWKRDLDRIVDAQRRALVAESPPVLADWRAAGGDPADHARDALEALARTLDAWPALFHHARQHSASLLQD